MPMRRSKSHKALTAIAYAALAVAAFVTLVPFAYLACSSVKTKAVFFSSPFLPTSGLFEIEPATGQLIVIDDTHLQGPPPWTRSVTIEAFDPSTNEPIDSQPVTATITPTAATEGGMPEGYAVAFNAQGFFERVPPGSRFRIIEGNPHGLFGVAWGQLTLAHYARLFTGLDPSAARYALNSFFYASFTVVLATLFCAMGGYALAKFRFKGRGLVTFVVFGTLVVPGAVMLAPMYQLVFRLGLLDSFTGLILPGVAPAFGVFLFRQAMVGSIPDELLEAARLDGCGEVRMFFIIALPLVRGMTGAFMLITYLAAWNNFIWPQIVIASPEKLPLAVGIAQLRDVYAVDYGMLMAATLVSITPVVALFLLLQRDFIQGLTAGAVKG